MTEEQREAGPVLVGYDGSESSRNAVSYAARQTSRDGRSLLVVHIHRSPASYDTGFGCLEPPDDGAELLEWRDADLSGILEPSEVAVELVEATGDPARRLAELATEQQTSAIVLGAPEHRLHHLIGSVPAWLARHARCPVTIAP